MILRSKCRIRWWLLAVLCLEITSGQYLRRKGGLFQSKMLGGASLDDYEKYSFFVSLGFSIPSGQHISFCGGTLIDSAVVLTAAHCLERLQLVQINFVNSTSHTYAISWETHPSYNLTLMQNDIALIYLEEGAVPNEISIAALPATSSGSTTTITTIGIGHTSQDDISSSWDQFREAEMQILSNSQRQCGNRYSLSLQLDRQFCANAPGQAPCRGDSGGPAIFNDAIVGIISYGACQVNVPTVFTKVQYYLPWIYQSICAYQTSQHPEDSSWWCQQQVEEEEDDVSSLLSSSTRPEEKIETVLTAKRQASFFGSNGGGSAVGLGPPAGKKIDSNNDDESLRRKPSESISIYQSSDDGSI